MTILEEIFNYGFLGMPVEFSIILKSNNLVWSTLDDLKYIQS